MIKKTLALAFKITESNKFLKSFKPVLNALDAALLGTGKVTTFAPHFVDSMDIKRYMSLVIIGLLPATAAAVYFFGFKALSIILVSYIFGGAVEVLFAIFRKKEIDEGFLVTGLIFALTLPPTVPLWIVAVGITFGVFFGKEVFGGSGRNVFNPALVGRLFITLAFPADMSMSWQEPLTHAVAQATPLMQFKSSHIMTGCGPLLSGKTAGSLGETFRAGLISGGVFLFFTKVSNWRVPVSYVASVAVFAFVGSRLLPETIAPPYFQLLSGGLMLGAFFMATDPVTSPHTKIGKYIFGVGCGFLTLVIRSFSGYIEGVMFSIILMNTFTPLIDYIILGLQYKAIKK